MSGPICLYSCVVYVGDLEANVCALEDVTGTAESEWKYIFLREIPLLNVNFEVWLGSSAQALELFCVSEMPL